MSRLGVQLKGEGTGEGRGETSTCVVVREGLKLEPYKSGAGVGGAGGAGLVGGGAEKAAGVWVCTGAEKHLKKGYRLGERSGVGGECGELLKRR